MSNTELLTAYENIWAAETPDQAFAAYADFCDTLPDPLDAFMPRSVDEAETEATQEGIGLHISEDADKEQDRPDAKIPVFCQNVGAVAIGTPESLSLLEFGSVERRRSSLAALKRAALAAAATSISAGLLNQVEIYWAINRYLRGTNALATDQDHTLGYCMGWLRDRRRVVIGASASASDELQDALTQRGVRLPSDDGFWSLILARRIADCLCGEVIRIVPTVHSLATNIQTFRSLGIDIG